MQTRITGRLAAVLALSLASPGALLGCGQDDPRIIPAGAGGGSRPSPAGSGSDSSENGSSGGGQGGAGSGSVGGSGTVESGIGGRSGSGPVGASGSGGAAVTPPLTPPESTGPLGEPLSDEEAQAWVFDDAEIHDYQLALAPDVWAALQANARDEQYADAVLSAGGQTLGRVGLRFKGSLGTLESCFADDGTPRCTKMSMKLKFDEYEPEQRFAGLKRLNFNSMLYDDSLMRERLAYRMFREMGVAAPRAAHARLIINGEDQGVFSLVEEVDGRFTKNHFAEGDGNLYKEAWPSNADAAVLAEALETNEDAPDHSVFQQFQADLLAATPAELPDVVASYLDLDNTLAYLAVDQALVNWDGVTGFFCYSELCENHNFYLYQGEGPARFTLIPWDLDNTFLAESPLVGVPGLFDAPGDCSVRYQTPGRLVMAPGCDPLLQGLVLSAGERYVAQLDRLLDGPLAPGILEGWLDGWQAELAPEVATDTRGPDVATFERSVEQLRSVVSSLRDRTLSDRATHQ
jgi:spore coat protein H